MGDALVELLDAYGAVIVSTRARYRIQGERAMFDQVVFPPCEIDGEIEIMWFRALGQIRPISEAGLVEELLED